MRAVKRTGFHLLVISGLCGALLFALALAASPHLHAHLHAVGGGAGHECVANLLASGKCEFTPRPTISLVPDPIPLAPIFSIPDIPRPALRFFALLEHAPPVLA